VRLEDGSPLYPLEPLATRGLRWQFFDETVDEFSSAQLDGTDVVIVGGTTVPVAALDVPRPPLLLARLGAGYDRVPVHACTERGIMVTTAPDGVRRAMASGAMAQLLALAHRLVEKDSRTRRGVWDRSAIGVGLSGATLGVLGLGNIGRDVCALAAPFAVRRIACDPYAPAVDGVDAVDLNTLLEQSDFVVVTLPLTAATHHLIDTERISRMKPGAYLINISRGPIVDQVALADAIRSGRIAGAALDVFEQEPVPLSEPLLGLDNVIVSGHDIGLTRELTSGIARSTCAAVIDACEGRIPATLLNPDVIRHSRHASLRSGCGDVE
jgi:phosphoglycerate dehydrogenase-like enzyme